MSNLTKKEIEHIEMFQKSFSIKEVDEMGHIFINCCNIIAKKKLYNFYIEYFENILFEALKISNKYNKNTYICHINLKDVKIKNFSYGFLKFANERINNNEKLWNTLKEARFYCKHKITKALFLFLYKLVDKDTRQKYHLIYG